MSSSFSLWKVCWAIAHGFDREEWDMSFPLLASRNGEDAWEPCWISYSCKLASRRKKNKNKILSQLPSGFIERSLGHLCMRLTFKKTKMKCCSWIDQFFVATVPSPDILSSKKKQKWSYLKFFLSIVGNKRLGLWYQFWEWRTFIYNKCISLLWLILCLPRKLF